MWKLIFVIITNGAGFNVTPVATSTIVTEFNTKSGCLFMQKHLTEKVDNLRNSGILVSTCIKAE